MSYRDNRKTGPQKVATISRPGPSVSSVSRPHHPLNIISTPDTKNTDSKQQWRIIDQDLRIEGHGETSGEHQGPEEQHSVDHQLDVGSVVKQLVL